MLRQALQDTGRIGIARVALRGKGSLAAIRLYRDDCLVMETMHFPEEIRTFAGLNLPAVGVGFREQELEMAKMLIGTLANPFVAENYRNEYREALLQLIQEKVAGQEVYRPEAPAPAAKVIDLMEALRKSINLAEDARERTLARGAVAVGGGPAPGPGARPAPAFTPTVPAAPPTAQTVPPAALGAPAIGAPPAPAPPVRPLPGVQPVLPPGFRPAPPGGGAG